MVKSRSTKRFVRIKKIVYYFKQTIQKFIHIITLVSLISVPHFLIIHDGGSVEDYTMNSETSPKINSYGQFPKSGKEACAMFDPDTMKVIMRQKTSKELMEWNFDDQTAKYMDEGSWDKNQNSRPYGPCATSSSGKLFLYSGNLNSKNKVPHYFQDNRGEVKDSEGML